MAKPLFEQVKYFFLSTWITSVMSVTVFAQPVTAQPDTFRYQFCARGVSEAPERPFTKTVLIELVTTGAALPEDLLVPVTEKLLKESLWPDPAIVVAVESDVLSLCPGSAMTARQIKIALTPEIVALLRADVGRGSDWTFSMHARLGKITVRLTRNDDVKGPAREWIKVFYATNRNRIGGGAGTDVFGTERTGLPEFGAIDVAVPSRPAMKDIQSPAIFKTEHLLDADTLELAGQLKPMSIDEWNQTIALRAKAFQSPGILVFFHGYNVPFASAARRAAQLAYDLAFPGPTVFFAWPSDGAKPSYLRDARDAENSSIAAAKVLDELSSSASVPVYVIAHSMGNRVMMEAYKRLLDEKPERGKRFREIIMAAPDVDQESFQLYTANKILPSGPRFTLYASKNDLALASSEFLQGGRRLGFGGENLYVQPHLDSIDASAVTREFFSLNHSYFGDKTTVMSDLFHLIRNRLPAAKRPNLRPTRVRDHPAFAIVP